MQSSFMQFKNTADVLLRVKDVGDVYAKISKITDTRVFLSEVFIENLPTASFVQLTITREMILSCTNIAKYDLSDVTTEELIILMTVPIYSEFVKKELEKREISSDSKNDNKSYSKSQNKNNDSVFDINEVKMEIDKKMLDFSKKETTKSSLVNSIDEDSRKCSKGKKSPKNDSPLEKSIMNSKPSNDFPRENNTENLTKENKTENLSKENKIEQPLIDQKAIKEAIERSKILEEFEKKKREVDQQVEQGTFQWACVLPTLRCKTVIEETLNQNVAKNNKELINDGVKNKKGDVQSENSNKDFMLRKDDNHKKDYNQKKDDDQRKDDYQRKDSKFNEDDRNGRKNIKNDKVKKIQRGKDEPIVPEDSQKAAVKPPRVSFKASRLFNTAKEYFDSVISKFNFSTSKKNWGTGGSSGAIIEIFKNERLLPKKPKVSSSFKKTTGYNTNHYSKNYISNSYNSVAANKK